MINDSPNIDGGLFDRAGLLGLPGIPQSKLIVNIISGRETISSSILPEKYKDCRLLTIVVEMNHPFVTPFNMATEGDKAVNIGKLSMQSALNNGHVEQIGSNNNHWVIYLDGDVSSMSLAASSNHLKDIKTTFSFVKSLSQSSLSELDAEDENSQRATKPRPTKSANSQKAQNGKKNRNKLKKSVK